MKTRDLQDLRKKDVAEIEKLVDAKRTEVMDLRFSLATGALEDSSRMARAKRDVAQVLTVLGEKRRQSGATASTTTSAAPATPAEETKA